MTQVPATLAAVHEMRGHAIAMPSVHGSWYPQLMLKTSKPCTVHCVYQSIYCAEDLVNGNWHFWDKKQPANFEFNPFVTTVIIVVMEEIHQTYSFQMLQEAINQYTILYVQKAGIQVHLDIMIIVVHVLSQRYACNTKKLKYLEAFTKMHRAYL